MVVHEMLWMSGIFFTAASWLKLTLTSTTMLLLSGITINALKNVLVQRSCCTYPGYKLTYECTVVGKEFGNTLWRGSAFDCRGNEITLRHCLFRSESGTAGDCNDGSIVAQSLREQDGCYTSRLNVTFTADLIGKGI